MATEEQATDAFLEVPRRAHAGPTLGGLGLRGLCWAALAVLVLWVPSLTDNIAYNATIGVYFAVVGLSMNVLVGYTGQLSLGQQGFFGLGAMVAANAASSGLDPAEPLSFAYGLALTVVIGAAFALVLGLVALRVTGLYLALLTLVFGVAVTSSIFGINAFNGQDIGVKANRPDFLIDGMHYYLFCLAVLLVVFYLDRRLVASKAGRAMLATKENERAAEAFGINVVGTKLLAFALSGAIAGLAGGLAVFLPQTFSQKDYIGSAGFNLALTFVVIAVVGGLGNRVGVVVASVFFGLLPYLMETVFGRLGLHDFYTDRKNFLPGLIGAVLLLDTVVRRPNGLGTLTTPISRWLAGRPFHWHDDAAGSEVAADVRA
ncbi:MAG: leucine/isoleucine/valine transporter permease subunit [Frankiales bacterium]|nr:leucine/isoleucine/valine transporter permease subunit [Frankiales bacterium]